MLETEQQGGALIMKIIGRIDGSNALELQDKVLEAAGECESSVVLDLADLEYISSAGLRVMLLLAKKLKSKKAQLVMCSVKGAVEDVLTISGFNAIISIYTDKASALEAIS